MAPEMLLLLFFIRISIVVVVWHIWNCYLCIFSSEELDWGELSLEWVPREKGNSAAVLQPTPLPAGWWSWWWSWLSSWSSWWSETEWMRIIITAPSERKLWASLAWFVSAFVWTGLPKELITWHISILELFSIESFLWFRNIFFRRWSRLDPPCQS